MRLELHIYADNENGTAYLFDTGESADGFYIVLTEKGAFSMGFDHNGDTVATPIDDLTQYLRSIAKTAIQANGDKR